MYGEKWPTIGKGRHLTAIVIKWSVSSVPSKITNSFWKFIFNECLKVWERMSFESGEFQYPFPFLLSPTIFTSTTKITLSLLTTTTTTTSYWDVVLLSSLSLAAVITVGLKAYKRIVEDANQWFSTRIPRNPEFPPLF